VVRTVIHDEEGAVLGYRWSIHDQTLIKQQDDRLRQSEGLLRSLIDGAQDYAIFRLDPSVASRAGTRVRADLRYSAVEISVGP
jgi:PAS domain-containing protein